MKYSIHGLTIESDIDLPLTPLSDNDLSNVDVYIKYEAISEALPISLNKQFCSRLSCGSIIVNFPDLATFKVLNGQIIHVDPMENTNYHLLFSYLFGGVFSILLHQRKRLVLHANAVLFDKKAILFAGDSGAGKSTLAAYMQQQGHQIIADDIVSIDEDLFIHGGYPTIKLWQNTLEKFDIPKKKLTPVSIQPGKFFLSVKNFNKTIFPVEISHIFILSIHTQLNENIIKIEKLKGINNFQTLMQHNYRNDLIEATNMQKHHLELCSDLAKNTVISSFKRPKKGFSVIQMYDELTDFIRN